jgi:hypothetical protein
MAKKLGCSQTPRNKRRFCLLWPTTGTRIAALPYECQDSKSCALPKCQTGTNWRPAIWITLAVTMNSRFLRGSLRLVYDQFMDGSERKQAD